MFSAASILLLAVICFSRTSMLVVMGKATCAGGLGLQWLSDPDDCSKYYMCYGSMQYEFDCGGMVWNPDLKTCVGRGSKLDKCTTGKNEPDATNLPTGKNFKDLCAQSGDSAIYYAKEDNCAQYYDCSSREATVSTDPLVKECEFPLLFSEETKRCEHYDKVQCGSRMEPLDACDYEANGCQNHAHCVPCKVRFPTCRNRPDGLNPWEGREPSPYYVLCQQQRPLYQGMCDTSKGVHLFDSTERKCVLKGITGKKEEVKTGTTGITDKNIKDVCAQNGNSVVFYAKADNCAQYFDCSSREATVGSDPLVKECEFPLLFSEVTKRCEHFDKVECGSRMEPLDACDYNANQCQGHARCVPCRVRFPTCRNRPDGLNCWEERQPSPYYVLCQQGRPLYQGTCDTSKGTQLFDPVKRICVEA